MLIRDPLSEGSSASSTDNEPLESGELVSHNERGTQDTQKGAACS